VAPALIAAAWAVMPAKILTVCAERAKAHVHLDVAAIARLDSGSAFLEIMCQILQPLNVKKFNE
jgi:hypothetical protein